MSGKRISISIIVPIFNIQAYLRECLESIKSQTFPDFEGDPDK
ncbi:glycosyltransferase [Paraburkholderia sp. D1E]